MSEPFLAEIKIVGFNFAPRGYAQCDGQILPIQQNQSLYSLLGTTYGGDGRTTFALPELRGRTPINRSDTNPLGQKAGEERVTITEQTLPAHMHGLRFKNANGTQDTPGDGGTVQNSLANAPGGDPYLTPIPSQNIVNMATSMVGNTGGGQGHENRQPYLALNYVIALQGLFPSRN